MSCTPSTSHNPAAITENILICGTWVEFPQVPFASQLQGMNQIIQSLSTSNHCLLESPSGSGKTLALLCASLAWQKQEKEALLAYTNPQAASSSSNFTAQFQQGNERLRCEKSELHRPVTASGVPTSGVAGGITPYTNVDLLEASLETEHIQTGEPLAKVAAPTEPEHNGSQREVILIDSSDEEESSKYPLITLDDSDSDSDVEILQSPKRKRMFLHYGNKEKRQTLQKEEQRVPASVPTKPQEDSRKEDQSIRPPKIFYGVRTHSQLQHVVQELRKTAYAKDIKMTVLGSRDLTCINPNVLTTSNKAEACLDLLGGEGCKLYEQAKSTTRPYLQACCFPNVFDIEDMVGLATVRQFCPYFTLTKLVEDADLIICPQNYLIDPRLASNMNINVHKSVVIIDDAHNIETLCRKAGSVALKEEELRKVIKTINTILKEHCEYRTEYRQIKVYLNDLCTFLQNTGVSTIYKKSGSEATRGISGPILVNTLNNNGITESRFRKFVKNMAAITKKETEARSTSGGIPSPLKNLTHDIKCVFNYIYDMHHREKYAVYMTRENYSEGAVDVAENQEEIFRYTLNFNCLCPSVVFEQLTIARSIILASSSLSPMVSYAHELNMKFSKLSAKHVVPDSNFLVAAVGYGPDGGELLSIDENMSTYNYQDQLGKTILSIARVVPHGVVCFLPSYSLMNALRTRWSDSGLYEVLENEKEVFWEPETQDEMNNFITAYKVRIEQSVQSPHKEKSAIMFGVYGGKIAEEVTFKDNEARAVIAVGIPVPDQSLNCAQKMEYNDNSGKPLNGKKWCLVQAFRRVNQVLGCCLGHENDWGAILLLDTRYKKLNLKVPEWIQEKVQFHENWYLLKETLKDFCNKMCIGK